MELGKALRGLWAAVARTFAFLRVALANVVVLAVLVAVIAALATGPGAPNVSAHSALLLDPKGDVVERAAVPAPNVLSLLGGLGSLAQTPLADILRGIERAADDDRIEALVFDPKALGYVAPAALEAIGDALAAFRDSGKPVVAKGRYYGRDDYYLASFSDRIYLHPLGEVMLGGYGRYDTFYAGALERLKAQVNVFRVGTFKAFVEPYERQDMSDAAKAANRAVVDALWRRFVDRVAANRGLDAQAVYRYANGYDQLLAAVAGDTAAAALDHGLVDEVLDDEALATRLRALAGSDDAFGRVALGNYLRPAAAPGFGDAVAVITAAGPILMGRQPPGAVGSENMAALLADAREDDDIKALVLRVDSGGGSVLASEIIREQVQRVQAAGKPVVVSMAGTAASGGYWIAATADEIWAAPTTITGSIGVFAILPTFEDSLRAVGISRDGVATGPLAGGLDPMRTLSEPMRRLLQASIEHAYDRFVALVAEGRSLSPEAVDAVGQGRIWTGEQALARGLVDQLGGLDDAISRAAELADLPRFAVRHLEDAPTPLQALAQRLIDDFGIRGQAAGPRGQAGLVGPVARALLREWQLLDALNDPKHVYALCDACGPLL